MKSKSKQAKHQNLAKARAKNPNHSKSMDSITPDLSLDTVILDTQPDSSQNSASDDTPDDLAQQNAIDSDETPDELDSSDHSDGFTDPDFMPKEDKLLIIPFSFIQKLMKLVCCPSCKGQGSIDASVTSMCGFFNDISFVCRCKQNFSLANFDDTNITDVLVRNLITNGIPKQPFQRWLQVGNFGAIVNGQECSTNLFTRNSMASYKEQNNVIIQGAEDMHKLEVERLFRANQNLIVSTDMCYAKRGYHSKAGHAALISGGKVIDARTIKRASEKSENAFGDIVDKQANKIEAYAVVKMFKDVIPVIGPLITRIDVDQDASLQDVIVNMKWEAEDLTIINKFTGRKEITEDMIGKSVWGSKIPEIYPDKVSLH